MNNLKNYGLILTLSMSLVLSACAAPASPGSSTTKDSETTTTTETTAAGAGSIMESSLPTESTTASETTTTKTTTTETNGSETDPTTPATALELLNAIWASYPEADQFPAGGGDVSEENMSMEGPGIFSLDDLSALDNALGLPQDAGSAVDNAASLVHMMNANTFTSGAFHTTDEMTPDDLATKLQENIQTRQWMCGFPENLLILSIGEYTISAFGHSDLIEAFKTHATATFPDAKVLVEEPIQ